MDDTFNGTFWLSVCGIISGVLALIFAAVNKSKCSSVECCCFRCIRNVDAEVELEEHRIDHNTPDTPRNNMV